MNRAQGEQPHVSYQHVLVPLDGSQFAKWAVPTARALADRFGARLHTISAVDRAEDADRLRQHAVGALGVTAADDRVQVVVGDAATAIARRATELEACLVCLATHARGRFAGAIAGSVARSVLHQVGAPVVVVGPFASRPPPFVSRWPEPLAVNRIVACVDGSDASESVLPVAAAWARALEMSLTILMVAAPVIPPFDVDRRAAASHGPNADTHDYVRALEAQWTSSVPRITARVILDPISPAMGVRRYLDTEWAGLLAVATRARSGWNRLVGGAAAAKILRASTAPGLVVPSERTADATTDVVG